MKSTIWIAILLTVLAIGYFASKDDIYADLNRNDGSYGSPQEFAINIQDQVLEDLESEFNLVYTPELVGQYLRENGSEELLDEEVFKEQVEVFRQMASGVQAIIAGVQVDEAFIQYVLPTGKISKQEWQQIVSQENKAGLLNSLKSESEKSFDDHKQALFVQLRPMYRTYVIRNRICSKLQSNLSDELQSIEEEFGVIVDNNSACVSMAHKWFLTQAQVRASAAGKQPYGWEKHLNPFGYNELRTNLIRTMDPN